MIDTNLAPIRHVNSDKHERVPVHIHDGKHTIFTGDNHRRYFNSDNLPDVLKHKLSMINGSPDSGVEDRGQVTNIDVYIMPKNIGDFEFIGWKVTDEMYCVVLTNQELNSLRKVDGDTGE